MGKQSIASPKRCESKRELQMKKSKSRVEVETQSLQVMGNASEVQPGDHRQEIRKSEQTQGTKGCP